MGNNLKICRGLINDVIKSTNQNSGYQNQSDDGYQQHQAAAAPSNVSHQSGGGEQHLGVLFFPDEAFPCRNYQSNGNCRRNNCKYSHKRTSLVQLLEYIKSAKSSLDICVFSITNDDISNELIAAHKRGVIVRIITDDDQAQSNGSDIKRLSQAGIPVRDDNSDKHMHHKFCIVDKTVLLNGSFNWTRQAVIGNRENIVITKGAASASFVSHFEYLWKQYVRNKV